MYSGITNLKNALWEKIYRAFHNVLRDYKLKKKALWEKLYRAFHNVLRDYTLKKRIVGENIHSVS